MKRGGQSPLSRNNKSQARQDPSPKKPTQKSHTIYNEQKLKVFVKFKPQMKGEAEGEQIVSYVSDKQIEIKTALKNRMYRFDHVFTGDQTSREVFDIGCKDLIDQIFLETYQKSHRNNGLIFVYGNTGTGKTYSMGLLNKMTSESEGIVPDSIRHIFQMRRKKCYDSYLISISFCEVYMDEVYDLLDFEIDAKLSIRQESKTKQPYLENETIIGVSSVEQAFQIINIGLEKRRVAEQRMNRKSSRGHGLITVNITPQSEEKGGKMCFIDLAGCERLKDSESKGLTLNEALHINSSLSSLETLLMNISDQNVRNYRSSKLTRILQPYIEFGSINLFVTSTGESINAVEFAKRCKGIRFMERELRASTPIKRSNISQKLAGKQSKQLQQLQQFKKQALQREKQLLACISSLAVLIQRLSGELQETFKGQTLHSKFSFSEIINDCEVQNRINGRIREYEEKQQKIIEYNIDRLIRNSLYHRENEELWKAIVESPLELVRELHDHTADMVSSIKAFGVYAEYKNIYKKQFFTSELKLHLIESKCRHQEASIQYLLKHLNTGDKRVLKKLKELGLGKENLENNPHLRNKRNPSKSTDKMRSIQKQEALHQHQTSFNNSERRSAIYIDEI